MAAFDRYSKIAFVGAGTVGGSLSLALSRKGYSVVAVASRTPASAQAFAERIEGCTAYSTFQEAADQGDVVFITTSDDAIASVASAINWRPSQAALHCSGAASLDLLDKPQRVGASVGGFHPLQAFSSVENGAKSIEGTTFGIEATDDMRQFLADMATDIGGNPIFLRSEDKVLYHLSGVMMGNLLTCLAGVAAQLWDKIGSSRADGVIALAPMMKAVAHNLESSGLPDAVAGPFPRGDIGTIRKHLEALRAQAPEVMPLYCELALAGLPLATEKGSLPDDRAAEIRDLVNGFKSGQT